MPTARAFWMGFAVYVVPSLAVADLWHLVVFAAQYKSLGIYRGDVIMPLGLASRRIQGAAFSAAYPRIFPERRRVLRNGVALGVGLALLSWSFTTLAVAAKQVMTSVPDYLVLETGFTLLQFAVVGPSMAWAYRD